MASVELIKQAVSAHTAELKGTKVRNVNPDIRHQDNRQRQRPRNPQIQVIQDNRSTHSGASRNSDPGSVRSTSRNVMAVFRMKKKLAKWRNSKMSSVSLNRQMFLENTYQMEPDSGTSFNSERTKAEIEAVLRDHLDPLDGYLRDRAAQLVPVIADDIKYRVKALGFSRYKIVVHIVIGENAGQGLEVASRGVWDIDTDRMIPVTYQKNNLFALATVFGTYFE